MDRFFSKLDLRDIKIDPFNTSFPPDADEDEAEAKRDSQDATSDAEAEVASVDRDAAVDLEAAAPETDWQRPERRPHVPAWEQNQTINGRAQYAAPPVQTPEETYQQEPTADYAVDESDDVAAEADDRNRTNSEVLKVSARSRPSAVAGAIAGVVRENGRAEVQAIGAGATNQAVKAVAIARDYLRETGIEAICLPAFIDVTIDNEDRTAIRLVVEPR